MRPSRRSFLRGTTHRCVRPRICALPRHRLPVASPPPPPTTTPSPHPTSPPFSTPSFNNNTTPLAAIQQWLPRATGIKGVPSVNSNDQSGIAAAATAAAAADLVIMTIGSDLGLEQEGHDRTAIDISAAQLALVAAVATAAKAPIIAIVFSGGAMDVSPLLSNPKVGAIFWVGQPSVQIAAIGDQLFGRTLDGRQYSPAGRMNQVRASACAPVCVCGTGGRAT